MLVNNTTQPNRLVSIDVASWSESSGKVIQAAAIEAELSFQTMADLNESLGVGESSAEEQRHLTIISFESHHRSGFTFLQL